MSAHEQSSGEQPQYLSKRVMINGQFVTLYSTNGVTWLSSPEDLQDTMARLENTRVTLGDVKPGEGDEKSDKSEKGEKGDKGAKAEKVAAPPPKLPGSQYRMKGPKPRPILRQGGKVVEGTPIEPVSASSLNMKGAADATLPTVKFSPMEQGLRRGKIVAPLAQRRPGKVKEALAKAKKGAVPSKVAAPVPAKQLPPTKAPIAAKKKGVIPPAPVKAAKVSAPASKVAKAGKATPPVKKVAKAAPVAKKAVKAKKVVAKKPAAKPAKKVAVKGNSKKRSR